MFWQDRRRPRTGLLSRTSVFDILGGPSLQFVRDVGSAFLSLGLFAVRVNAESGRSSMWNANLKRSASSVFIMFSSASRSTGRSPWPGAPTMDAAAGALATILQRSD